MGPKYFIIRPISLSIYAVSWSGVNRRLNDVWAVFMSQLKLDHDW